MTWIVHKVWTLPGKYEIITKRWCLWIGGLAVTQLLLLSTLRPSISFTYFGCAGKGEGLPMQKTSQVYHEPTVLVSSLTFRRWFSRVEDWVGRYVFKPSRSIALSTILVSPAVLLPEALHNYKQGGRLHLKNAISLTSQKIKKFSDFFLKTF